MPLVTYNSTIQQIIEYFWMYMYRCLSNTNVHVYRTTSLWCTVNVKGHIAKVKKSQLERDLPTSVNGRVISSFRGVLFS